MFVSYFLKLSCVLLYTVHNGWCVPVPHVSGDSLDDLEKSQEEKTRSWHTGVTGIPSYPAQSSATMHQLISRPAPLLVMMVMMVTVTRVLGAEQCPALSGERCTFPFSFNNTEYSACTGAGHPIGRPRCLITVGKLLKSKLGKVGNPFRMRMEARTGITVARAAP